jgi:hypothetical protein
MTYVVALDVDPSLVRPGWTAFVVILLLAIAMVFLFFSMRRQFRKINVGQSDDSPSSSSGTSGPESPGDDS